MIAAAPRVRPVVAFLCFASLAILPLAGCGAGAGTQLQDVQSAAIAGHVHGGEQPVQLAHIALFATTSATPSGVNTPASVYGGSLTPIATTTSDTTGSFSFSGIAYTCPAGQQAYVVAAGGNPGLASGTDNSAIFLVAALGPCSGLAAIPYIDIDEATTVAAAYALSGFAPAGGVGMTEAAVIAGTAMPGITTSSTNTQGLADAFANAANIVNISSGTAYTATPGGSGTVPQNIIYALANVLQSCVNGSSPSGGQCPGLFTNATPPAGAPVTTAPVNVFQAALNIAQYPGNNATALYNLVASSGSAAFVPVTPLAGAPNDWTIGVTYTSSLLVSGTGLGVDARDNVYVSGAGYLIDFTAQGAAISSTNLLAGDAAITTADTLREIAFDASGNLFVTDGNVAGVYEYNPATTALTKLDFSVAPAAEANANTYAVAVDGHGDVWTTSYSKATCATVTCPLVEFPSTATAAGPYPAYAPFTSFGGFSAPQPTGALGGARGIAFDVKTGNIWITAIDDNLAELFKVSPGSAGVASASAAPTQLTGFGSEVGTPATNTAYGTISVAVDSTSRAWFVVAGGPASTKSGSTTSAIPAALYPVSSTGTVGTGVTGGGLSVADTVVVDGNNNLFVAGAGSGASTSSVIEYSPSFSSNAGAFLSPNIGFSPSSTYSAGALSGGALYEPSYLAIDRSGALWALSSGNGTSHPSNLIQILGVAAPVNPVLAAGQYGVKP